MSSDEQDLPKLYGYTPEQWDEAVDSAVFSGRARREATRLLKEEEMPSEPRPPIMGLTKFLQLPRDKMRFRIQEWQPLNSRVVMAAQAKTGKTHATHNLVRSLVDGDRWLGKWKVIPIEGTVAILDLELSPSQAADWLEVQGIKHPEKVKFCSLRGAAASFNIIDPGIRAEWAAELAEANVDYLIFDCLRPVLDALMLDEHKDAGKFFVAFDALLKEAGVAEAMIVHHMGHAGTHSRGDSRIQDWPDVNWRLTLENMLDPNTSDRYIYANGRDVAVSDWKLILDMQSRRLTAVRAQKGEADAEAALQAALSVLADKGDPCSGRTIENELKDTEHTRKAIRSAMRLGIRRGVVDTRAGAHNATLYELPQSWARRAGGGSGGDNYDSHD